LGISVVPVVLGRKLSIKSKSLTDVEVIKKVIVVPDLATSMSPFYISHKSRALKSCNRAKPFLLLPNYNQMLTNSQAIQTLKSQEPPEDLHQVRARSASVKETNREIRKRAVTLIRSRTASRASALGRPSISNDGRPNLADIQQGKQT